jgi:hypothetical protein
LAEVEAMISRAEAIPLANKALQDDDVAGFRELLDRCPELRAGINEPISHFDSPLIIHVRSEAMLEALLKVGADINARSKWWAGGFGLLDTASPEVAASAIKRGALVTVHAAARLGMIDKLKELIARRRSTLPRPSRSPSFCSIGARISMRAMWTTSRLRRNTCCVRALKSHGT